MNVFTYFPSLGKANQYGHLPTNTMIDFFEPLVGNEITMVEWNEKEITTICPKCGSEAGINKVNGKKFWNCFDCFHAWEYVRFQGEKEK